jgi:short-subunit dehydrogenase
LIYLSADLGRPDAAERLALAVQSASRSISVLVHSAGVFYGDADCDAESEAIDRQLMINFVAAARLTDFLENHLVSGEATVVFVGSTAASEPSDSNAYYAASKAALKVYSSALRKKLNDKGVRVVHFSSGRTKTPMQDRVARQQGTKTPSRYLIQPATLAALITNVISLPRDIEVTEVTVRPLHKAPATLAEPDGHTAGRRRTALAARPHIESESTGRVNGS